MRAICCGRRGWAEVDLPGSAAEAFAAQSDAVLSGSPHALAQRLLGIAEATLERWLRAHGVTPTARTHEGFRLLALQRQAARPDPSFNACRESCRELVYHCNVAVAGTDPGTRIRHFRMAAAVAIHLQLFIDGKLENARLGEFCCASRPLRAADAAVPSGAEET